jgi:hypothetical protein
MAVRVAFALERIFLDEVEHSKSKWLSIDRRTRSAVRVGVSSGAKWVNENPTSQLSTGTL